ncbi:MAG: GGDEF domain-containing protein [Rubrivivax sp.]|nr:GGDEF domain-containing protein [Rubrivivax sp.]
MSGSLLLRFMLLCACCVLAAPWPARAAAPLVLDARSDIDAWPAVTVFSDASGKLDLQQVLEQRMRFAEHTGTPGNLGRRSDAVWLHLALVVPGPQPAQRVLEIDYPSLNRVDVYLLTDGRVGAHHRLGNALPHDSRPLPSRTIAAPLTLAAGEHELLLRVQTQSSMVLPMRLRTPESFMAQESIGQLLQGMVVGLALCMLLYSVTHWINLRDPAFLDYALLLGGSVVFLLSYHGVGAQYLWPDWPQWSTQIAPLAVLLATVGATRFTRATLAVREISPVLDRVLRGIGVAALASVLAGLVGLLSYPQLQTMATVLGVSSTAGGLPVAYWRARRGEAVGIFMLFGWGCYLIGALTTAVLLRGYLEPTVSSLYLYATSSMVEMAAWMLVLGLRVQAMHRSADRARVESETLHALAHTDALTGLPNRRGLQSWLDSALEHCAPGRLLAVYLLDLDDFKPVNDRLGHDAGDAVLVAVGRRLQAELRGSDVVARLGGDEFVVLASGLADEGAARALGDKILAAFVAPFEVAGTRCQLGVTVGYALAPGDGVDARALLRLADTAMYCGKNGGRSCVQRAEPGWQQTASADAFTA